ncbi:MAG: sulfatase-like hydrolase/transferase [Verrucomicrobiota bacterium]
MCLHANLLPQGDYNVIFIFVDDLKPKIGAFGDNQTHTPNLDSFASTAVRFTNAHCQQAVCGPSRNAILTGLRPDTSNIWTNNNANEFRTILGRDFITLPQHFSENGYTTYGISKIFHSNRVSNTETGLSWNDGYESANAPHIYYEGTTNSGKWLLEDNGTRQVSVTDKGEFNYRESPPRAVTDEDYHDGLAAQAALAKLGEYSQDYLNNNKLFYLHVGFKKPHLPFAAPKAYWDLYDPDSIDLSYYDGSVSLPEGGEAFTAPIAGEVSGYEDVDRVPTLEKARELIHGYMACVSFIDAQIGKVLNALHELDPTGNLASNTVVLISGDHGWHLGDHGNFWTKQTVFEQATRTPLLIRSPGMSELGTAGRECSAPVELINIYPTLVDLAGLQQPQQPNGLNFEGHSLRPLLENPQAKWSRPAFSQFHKRISIGDINNEWGMGYSLRNERYRYTEWYVTDAETRDQKQSSEPVFSELYDYLNDPDETTNLAVNSTHQDLKEFLSLQLNGGNGWKDNFINTEAKHHLALLKIYQENLLLQFHTSSLNYSWQLQASEDLKTWSPIEAYNPLSIDLNGFASARVPLLSKDRMFIRAFGAESTEPLLPGFYELFNESLQIYLDGDFVVIESNGVPDHRSPYFNTDDPRHEAYNGPNPDFRLNPNRISESKLVFRIPLDPAPANNNQTTRLGPFGIARNGVALFNQYAGPNEPLTREINTFDQHNGHPTGADLYHYHVEPLYLTEKYGKEAFIGVLLDGYPVYGPEENGKSVTNNDLDEFHGHFGPTPDFPEGIYHYHITLEAPYINGGEYYGTPGTQTN